MVELLSKLWRHGYRSLDRYRQQLSADTAEQTSQMSFLLNRQNVWDCSVHFRVFRSDISSSRTAMLTKEVAQNIGRVSQIHQLSRVYTRATCSLQHVARTGNMLLVRATCCLYLGNIINIHSILLTATSNMLSGNMLPWCKRSIRQILLWPLQLGITDTFASGLLFPFASLTDVSA